jgi:hypothetical protein
MRRTMAAAVAVLALAACGGGGDSADPSTSSTSRPTTTAEPATTSTTSPPVGEAAFRAAASDRLDFGGGNGLSSTLALGQAVCDSLDANQAAGSGGPAMAELLTAAAVQPLYDELGADVAVVVLDLTGQHLCPEHAATIDAEVAARA